MTTFGRLKKLTDLKKIPELGEGFWDSYLSNLKERMEIVPVPLFPRIRPAPLISFISITLITITVLTTIGLYKPPVLDLENLPRKSIIEELTSVELDNLVAENFNSENIIGEFIPKEIISPIGGEYYEIL